MSMMLLAVCLGFFVNAQGIGRENVYENFEFFGRAFQNVRNYYYDTEKIKPRDLIYGAVKGMLDALEDEHTSFLPPAELKYLSEETSGEYGGLGIVIGIRNRVLTVVSPIYGTPAWEKHIQSGDVISFIDGVTTADLPLNDALRKLRGPAGTSVTVTLLRPNHDEPFDVTIERALIQLETVKTAFLEKEGIAYIKLTQFSENTVDLLKKAYESHKANPLLKSMIIDLRNNPGGLLTSATEAANLFIPEGLLVYTKGREPETTHSYMASRSRFVIPESIPIAVLVNKGSASASEILAGALQDTKRAVIIGETTFGKASVQSIRPLSDGSAIKLTVALYYTPAGREIHQKGLTPDIVVGIPEYSKTEQKALNRLLNEEYLAQFVKQHPVYTKAQLDEFANMLKSKDIDLPPEELERWIYWEKNKIGEPELINLRFDLQLRKAVELLTNGNIQAEKKLQVYSEPK
jgi:carboxyl-terminal processing protease